MLPQLTVRLVNKTQLSTNTFLLKFLLKNPGGFTFRAGQYVMLKINDANNHPVVRLYSLASKDGEVKDFELIIEPVPGGVASGYFTRLKINDEVNFYGPAGVFALKKTGRPVIFLATGSGVAPIRSMLVSNIKSGNGLYSFFWGLQTKNQVCLFDELKQLEKSNHNFKFYYCLSREPALSFVNQENQNHYVLGRVNVGIKKLIESPKNCDFYLCGRKDVVESLRQYLLGLGVSPAAIFFEKF